MTIYNTTISLAHPIEITRHMDFCLGTALTHVLRSQLNGDVEYIERAREYLVWTEGEQQMHPCDRRRLRAEAAEKLCLDLLNTVSADAQILYQFVRASEIFTECLSRPASSDTRRITAQALQDMRTQLDALQQNMEARP